MDWHQIGKGWKHLVFAVASPRGFAPEIESQANPSNRYAVSGGEGDEEARMRPYIPDSHSERDDSSLHMSC